MALDANIVGTNLDANNNIKVSLTNTPAYVGSVRAVSENDAGTYTGVPYLKQPETSTDFRLRVGMDTMLFNDIFNTTLQNTSLWSYTFNTMTATLLGNGQLQFGTVQGTTSAHGLFMRTFQYFPIVDTAPLAVNITCGLNTATLVANEILQFGLGLPTAATTPATDGVWFQVTSAGVIGVLMYNNTTTQTGTLLPLNALTLGSLFKFTIIVGPSEVEFWFEDLLLGEIAVPVSNGEPFIDGSLPLFMMKYNTGNVSSTNTVRFSSVSVSLMDILSEKPWSVQMAGMGQAAYIQQNGNNASGVVPTNANTGVITSGSSPIAPTAAAGSNTVANALGLGGWGTITAAAGAATDFIATAFLNPASTINITGRTLYVTGISISTMNGGAVVATTSTTLLWSVAFGHTAVSLATAETASFATATTHAPRRIQLGFQTAPVNTAIGGVYTPDVIRQFNTPIVVRPGEYFSTIMKIAVGTATASQTIVYNVTVDGFFE